MTVVPGVTCNGLGLNMKVRTVTSSFDDLGGVTAAVSPACALHAVKQPMERTVASNTDRRRPFVGRSRKSNTQPVRGQVVTGLQHRLEMSDGGVLNDLSASNASDAVCVRFALGTVCGR